MSPELRSVALCSRCPVGLSGRASTIPKLGTPGNPPPPAPHVGCVHPPVVVEGQLPLNGNAK